MGSSDTPSLRVRSRMRKTFLERSARLTRELFDARALSIGRMHARA